jgi:hypothetical protein
MSINLAHFSDVGDVEMVFDKGGESEVGQNKAVQWSGGGSAYFILSIVNFLAFVALTIRLCGDAFKVNSEHGATSWERTGATQKSVG